MNTCKLFSIFQDSPSNQKFLFILHFFILSIPAAKQDFTPALTNFR